MDLRNQKSVDKLFQPEAMMYPAKGFVLDNNVQSLKQVKCVLYQVRNLTIAQVRTTRFVFFVFVLKLCYIWSKTSSAKPCIIIESIT